MTGPRFSREDIAARKAAIQKILIEHDQLIQVEDELHMRILAGGGTEAAKLTMLVAPSGCGKTTTVKQAKMRLERNSKITQQSLLPILYCSLPAKCSIKTMTTAMLQALNDPLAERHGTAGANSLRIIRQLQAQRVRLLIIDEFQHLVSEGKSVVLRETTDWLKEVLDGAGVPVVCVGLPESLTVVARHEQIRRRTTKLIRMKPFEWDDGGPESAKFRAFLHLFEKELDLPVASNLGGAEFAERIHIASGGLIGVVTQLACEAIAVSMSRPQGPDCIAVADFAEAYDGLPYEGANPFDIRIAPCDVREGGQIADTVQAVHRNAGPRKPGARRVA